MDKLNSEVFIEKSKDMLVEFYNTLIDADYSLDSESINIIFFGNIRGDYKVFLSTFLDEFIYEITYDNISEVFCFDVYRLCSHQVYTD